jgi:coenzyme F420-reducing hydrogenase beta subunit
VIKVVDKSKCSGCHACLNVCPQDCINMAPDEKGFLYPLINEEICNDCNICEKVCPIINKVEENNQTFRIGYMAYNKNDSVRTFSSSGGIFSLLSEYIINSGGIVVGSAMSDDCKSAKHLIARSIEELSALRGSKYIQSTIGTVLCEIRQYLFDGKLVLFSGTPCQIAALHSFLGKRYDNLYTQDIICHGVPSPLVWNNYIKYLENKYNSIVRTVFFRDKSLGWHEYSLLIRFVNGKKYQKYAWNDTYMKGYLENLFLRPSCYNCSFKTINRQADITLADFWGIQEEYPNFDDDKGVTFVMVNSSKGQKLFQMMEERMVLKKIDIMDALKYNPAVIESVVPHPKSDYFWENYNGDNLKELVNICCYKSLYRKIRSELARKKRKIQMKFLRKINKRK